MDKNIEKQLKSYFVGIDLTDDEKQALDALRHFDDGTVENMLHIFHKLEVGRGKRNKLVFDINDMMSVLGVSDPTIRKMIKDPSFPLIRNKAIGNRKLVRSDKFLEYLDERG